MITDLRQSKRYTDFLPISVSAKSGVKNSFVAGPFSGRIVDISRHGACLLMTQVMSKSFHIFHSTKEDNSLFLELYINIPPDLVAFALPARPVWMNTFDMEDIRAFRMGVNFLMNPDGEKMKHLERIMGQKQKQREEHWKSITMAKKIE
ncbi:hypothetical protein MNBD_DELTA04-926 [hydrothermal vent metagenome]|uniref:PilZ domain-containing protein n=1 Tax=hydrothermal vent metagenome TaxID=652676 RepID=A0A3B0VGC0_9ZZZZ